VVLAAGIPAAWLGGDGIAVKALRTRHGMLSYSLRRNGTRVTARIEAGAGAPSGGFVLVRPDGVTPQRTRINGKAAAWSGNELAVRDLPATIVIDAR